MTKTINNIPVSDDVFAKMALLQERLRRIEAESRLLILEKAEAEREVNDLMKAIEASAKPPEIASVPSPTAA